MDMIIYYCKIFFCYPFPGFLHFKFYYLFKAIRLIKFKYFPLENDIRLC